MAYVFEIIAWVLMVGGYYLALALKGWERVIVAIFAGTMTTFGFLFLFSLERIR